MKIGIPQGLLYSKYHIFAKNFLEELGTDIVISPCTNKWILDEGIRSCVDEACLPMKIFHGHVSWLKDKCDSILIPRFISIKEEEYICPMFCGLIEMVSNDIPQLPNLIDTPIHSFRYDKLSKWAQDTASSITKDKSKVLNALDKSIIKYKNARSGFNDEGYLVKIGLIGHAYNIFDSFINMNLKNKLNSLGIGVITSDYIDKKDINVELDNLYKKPFWTYAKEFYGSAVSIYRNHTADGIIYLSSFSCGIDSVVTELIKSEIGNFPFLILKLDEHTGEAGLDTRIEAFSDMLKRRCSYGNNFS